MTFLRFMKCLLQRVAQASVTVDHGIVGEIQRGLLVFVGVEPGDADQSVLRMAKRILSYRIFRMMQER
jgi:D-tyrosyl-tRNA(Tyr) deacylase